MIITLYVSTSVVCLDSDWLPLSVFDKVSMNNFLLLVFPNLRQHLIAGLWGNHRGERTIRHSCWFGNHKGNFWFMFPNLYIFHKLNLFFRAVVDCNWMPCILILFVDCFGSCLFLALHQRFFFLWTYIHKSSLINYINRILILVIFTVLIEFIRSSLIVQPISPSSVSS